MAKMIAWTVILLFLLIVAACASFDTERLADGSDSPVVNLKLRLPSFTINSDHAEEGKLRLQDAEILQGAGWFKYVVGNIDKLRYENVESFEINGTTAIGYATIEDGKRVAIIATRYPAASVCRVLVHEAAHLEIWSRTGKFGSQEYSRKLEISFLRDYAQALRHELAGFNSQLRSFR